MVVSLRIPAQFINIRFFTIAETKQKFFSKKWFVPHEDKKNDDKRYKRYKDWKQTMLPGNTVTSI